MSSLFGAMAGAAANAMEGAAIGRAIGGANDRAAHAENQADVWYEHSQKLEALVDNLRVQLKTSENSRLDLAKKLAAAEQELSKFKVVAKEAFDQTTEGLDANVKYGREIKKRLRQMEKALQHSSADTVSVNFMLNTYKDLFGDFSELLANGNITQETKDRAETVWKAFMSGEKLTASQPVQDIIDQAPMPEKKPGVII
jgi:septal ring factor EnvC (AmiA/AmiB activator)